MLRLTLSATQSATALKAAACATLNDTGGYVNNATMKLSPQGNRTILPNKNEAPVHGQSSGTDGRSATGVFEEETRARQEQRRLMDELHGEQMKRIDEIEEELDQAMAELKAFIYEFMRKLGTRSHAGGDTAVEPVAAARWPRAGHMVV
eukprot:Skav221598  [mRNA]  locus=scaffold1698:470245:478486:+ [translate_table: standard]